MIVVFKNGDIVNFDVSMKQISKFSISQEIEGFALSWDQTRFLVYSMRSGTIWNFTQKQIIKTIVGGIDAKYSKEFLVIGCSDMMIRTYSYDGTNINICSGLDGLCISLDFSPDETKFFTVLTDKTIRIWDSSGEISKLKFSKSLRVSWKTNSKISILSGKTEYVWDVFTKKIDSIPIGTKLICSKNKTYVGVVGEKAIFLQTKSAKYIFEIDYPTSDVVFSDDEKWMATIDRNSIFYFWNVKDGICIGKKEEVAKFYLDK